MRSLILYCVVLYTLCLFANDVRAMIGHVAQHPPSNSEIQLAVTVEDGQMRAQCASGGYWKIGGLRRGSFVASMSYKSNDIDALADEGNVTTVLNTKAAEIITECAQSDIGAMLVFINGPPLVGGQITAWRLHPGGSWHIENSFSDAVRNRDQNIEHEREAARQQQEEATRKAHEAQALEVRRKAALSDCGSTPDISGGPWFSWTYKSAARDEARRRSVRLGMHEDAHFLCVKAIEYVGPIVNPFGGNSAQATFTGYDAWTFKPVRWNVDFPY